MSFIITSSARWTVNYHWYSRDSLIIMIPGQWLAGWLSSVAWSGTCHSWWMGKTKGALDGAIVGEWRARGRVRSWGLCWTLGKQRVCRCSPAPSTTLTYTRGGGEKEGGTDGSVGLHDHREDKKREKASKWVRNCMCFPQARQQLWDNDLCFSQNSGISKCYI